MRFKQGGFEPVSASASDDGSLLEVSSLHLYNKLLLLQSE